jgi:3-isopropylmalate dehydrogenase
MMLSHLGEKRAAQRVENAIVQVLGKHVRSLAAGEMGHTTQEVGDLVVKYL